jgi:hypothetical protein
LLTGRARSGGEIEQFEVEVARATANGFAFLRLEVVDFDVEFEGDRRQTDFVVKPRKQTTSTGGLLDRIGNGCNIMTHVNAHVTGRLGLVCRPQGNVE